MANRTRHIVPDDRPRSQKQVASRPDEHPLVIKTSDYIEEIWTYYDDHKTVPDLLPSRYKQFLIARGMAEYLPNTEKPYVVFSEKGSQMYQAWWKEKYRRKGKVA